MLEVGVFPFSRNKWGLTAEDEGKTHPQVLDVFKKHAARDPFEVAKNGDTKWLKHWMKGSVNNARASDGKTLLIVAVENNKFETVKWLLGDGANTDVQDKRGNTALHYAAMLGDAKMIDLLVKNGADISIKNNEKKIPAQLAPKLSAQFVVPVVTNEEVFEIQVVKPSNTEPKTHFISANTTIADIFPNYQINSLSVAGRVICFDNKTKLLHAIIKSKYNSSTYIDLPITITEGSKRKTFENTHEYRFPVDRETPAQLIAQKQVNLTANSAEQVIDIKPFKFKFPKQCVGSDCEILISTRQSKNAGQDTVFINLQLVNGTATCFSKSPTIENLTKNQRLYFGIEDPFAWIHNTKKPKDLAFTKGDYCVITLQ